MLQFEQRANIKFMCRLGKSAADMACRKNIPVLQQPPYSPDLAPSDFWLFPKLKKGLKGNSFDTVEDIKTNATVELRKIPQQDFHRCFQQWQERWSKCVCSDGAYFEGD